mgnify:CR=1 FL=1
MKLAQPLVPRRLQLWRCLSMLVLATCSVASLAQEMDPEVSARHIRLYVNQYTREIDERAIAIMLEWGQREGVFPGSGNAPLFVHP